MGEFDFTYILPENFEKRVVQYLLQLANRQLAEAFQHCMYFSVQEQKPLKEVYTGYTYFRDDDVLLAKVTPCFENGKSGLAKKLENGIGFGSSEFFVLRATPEKVLPEYIYYIINSNRFISEGTPQMTGTGGLRRLTKDFVLNYPVSLPPLDEQRKMFLILPLFLSKPSLTVI